MPLEPCSAAETTPVVAISEVATRRPNFLPVIDAAAAVSFCA
jgi:hypothetical protein